MIIRCADFISKEDCKMRIGSADFISRCTKLDENESQGVSDFILILYKNDESKISRVLISLYVNAQ